MRADSGRRSHASAKLLFAGRGKPAHVNPSKILVLLIVKLSPVLTKIQDLELITDGN